jgi:hypothetical protein
MITDDTGQAALDAVIQATVAWGEARFGPTLPIAPVKPTKTPEEKAALRARRTAQRRAQRQMKRARSV